MSRPLLLLLTGLSLLAPGAAQAARPLAMGFFDGSFSGGGADARLAQAQSVGATTVRIDIGWPAAHKPAHPSDPGDPAYAFATADAALRDATARGLTVLASFTGAPRWAEGAKRPRGAARGSWRPNPAALEAYGRALARRYDGTYPDPARPGQTLPRVRFFQVWNEPNLDLYLSPQWSGKVNVAPVLYRRMLNAFYAGVKAVMPSDKVVTAGTAPFGDPGRGHRTMPVRFWRVAMARRIRFDILAHHPYSVRGPAAHALNADDVSIPDMGKLAHVLAQARRRGTVDGPKPLWVTEVAYDSDPPDPDGVPIAQQARWLEQTFFLLWRQHVSAVFWFLVQDEAPFPSYAATNQGGVFYLRGTAKPAARAFAFPLVATRTEVWSHAPATGRLVVERRSAHGWTRLRTVTVSAGEVVDLHIGLRRGAQVRGRMGTGMSLVWKVR